MDDEADRGAILARRAALVAAALVGITGAATALGAGCDSEVVQAPEEGGGGADAEGGAGAGGAPQPCLGASFGGMGEGGRPQACLSAPIGGAGEGGAAQATGGAGGESRPCLIPR